MNMLILVHRFDRSNVEMGLSGSTGSAIQTSQCQKHSFYVLHYGIAACTYLFKN